MKTIKAVYNLKSKMRIKAMLGIVLASLILFSIAAPAFADEIDDQLAAKKDSLKQMGQEINQLRNTIAQKQKEIGSLNGQLSIIDSRVNLIQLQIRSTQMDIEKTTMEVDKTEKEIKEKADEISKQKELMGNVIREIYIDKGSSNLVSIVVESKNFSELVEKTEYLSRIRTKLKETVDKLNVLKAELEQRKADLETKVESLGQLKSDKEVEEAGLEDQKYAKARIIETTHGQESAFKALLAQAQAEEQAITNEVVRLVQEQARRRRDQGVVGREGRAGDIVMEGSFTYPLAGSNRISITGGDFMDPAYGMGFNHTGIDLAARQGTPIYSVGAGVIVVARDSGNAGLSYIAIDHGNGLVTKYLHMSAIYVTQGDVVNAGEVIGLSGGSPGTRGAGIFTTGAHLHFEINDYNGTPINPHKYLSFLPPLF